MLALALAFLLTSPAPPPRLPFYPGPELDTCPGQVVCPFDAQGGRYCTCAPAVLVVGSWNPVPYGYEWPANASLDAPKPHGEYPAEQHSNEPSTPEPSYTPGPLIGPTLDFGFGGTEY